MLDWSAQQADLANTTFATVFIGGGTPSLLPTHIIGNLLSHIPLDPDAEVTMEANPGTLEYANLPGALDAGVNRLSVGAQSFSDQHLRTLGRIHTAQETHGAFQQARQAGFDNINLDIMWGLPDQSVAQALSDLDAAINLAPEHISWYQLTIEAKTEFAQRTPLLPVEDTLAEIEANGLALLAEAGYQRYEVSAFARSQQYCRHNLNYWRFGDYIGIGPGAHGKVTGSNNTVLRTHKAAQPRLYQQDPATTYHTPIARAELPCEFMLNALRLVEGVEQTLFSQQTGLPWSMVESTWEQLITQELVQSQRCATTAQGMRYLDSVVAAFI